jgi:hypothetical protein
VIERYSSWEVDMDVQLKGRLAMGGVGSLKILGANITKYISSRNTI